MLRLPATRAPAPRGHRPRLGCAAASAMCLWALAASGATPTAEQILAASGVRGGLVVHVGCGDGRITAGLRVGAGYLVHGLDPDPVKVAAAREYIGGLGLYGPVSIDRLRGTGLPYIDNVVNLLVMTDGAAPSAPDELLRVLAPGGVAAVIEDGHQPLLSRIPHPVSRSDHGLALFTKPRPGTIDEWTHFLHGPDGNAVAADTVVGPPRHMQWLAAPNWIRNHHKLASISAVVSARGRVFYIVDEGPAASMAVPGLWFLVARDAFSGVLLWRRPLASWAWTGRGFRSGPVQLPRTLVADGNRVYTPLGMGEPVSVLDASSGRTIATYGETRGAEEIILDAGVLLAVTGSPTAEQAAIDPARRGQATYPNRKTIVAIRAGSTGDVLWTVPEPEGAPYMPLTLAAADGRVVFQAGKSLVCLARETGKSLWKWPGNAGPDSREPGRTRKPRGVGWSLATLVLHDGVVLWADAGAVTALQASDGKRLWSCPCRAGFKSPTDVLVVDGVVWLGPGLAEGRDLHTGEVTQTSTAVEDIWTVGHHHRCYREKATSRYILTGYRGIELLDLKGGEHGRNNWIRGVCQYGVMPCNGLIYAPAHACGCYMEARLFGFWAVAPERGGQVSGLRVQGVKDRRLEAGPAYRLAPAATEHRTPNTSPNPPASWPTYRHDPLRSGSTPARLHPALKLAWQTQIGRRLTAPVVAGGLVVVASTDAHRVVGLDAADGRTRWRFTAGGRVDSPPTLYGGSVLFGCADGWVYCLRASDGQEAWRSRAAPADVRTVAMDRVESVWPAHGSVLVDGGVAYVTAGRSSYLDSGIRLCALDPETGDLLHEATVSTEHPKPRARGGAAAESGIAVEKIVQNATDHKTFSDPDASDAFSMAGGATTDVLVGDGTSVFMRHLRFDRACVRQGRKLPHLFSTTRLLDDADVHRSHWVLGTGDFSRVPVAYSWIANAGGWRNGTRLAVPYGLMLAFGPQTAWGVRRRNGYTLYAEARQRSAPGQEHLPDFRKLASKDRSAWRWSGVLGLRPRAMLRAGDLLVLAGAPKDIDPADPYTTFGENAAGLLWTVSAEDGMRMAETKLASAPVWDGMAATEGRLYLATVSGHVLCMEADESAQLAPVKLAPPPQRRAKGKKPGPPGTPGKPVEPDRAGVFTLTPATARTTGRLRYQPDRSNLGAWVNSKDTCQWNLRGVKAGTYAVTFSYGSTNPDVEYTISAGERQLRGKTKHTGGIKTYEAFAVGKIKLPEGRVTLTIKPGPFKGAIMNFRLLTLTPVK